MSDTPAPIPPPAISPDGRFWWNGTAWVPFGAPPPLKSPGIHLLASALVPGLGTILAGRAWRGAAILAVAIVAWTVWVVTLGNIWSGAVPATCNLTPPVSICTIGASPGSARAIATMAVIGFVITAIWIFGLVDAYRSTQAWNRDHAGRQ